MEVSLFFDLKKVLFFPYLPSKLGCHPDATVAPFQCDCHELRKYLVILDQLKHCQKVCHFYSQKSHVRTVSCDNTFPDTICTMGGFL